MRYRRLDRSLALLIFPLMVVASACGKAPAKNAIGRGASSANVTGGAGAVRRRPPDPCTTIGDDKSGDLRLPSGVYPVSSKSNSHLTIGQLGCTWKIGSRNVLLAWIRTSESADLPVLEPILPTKDKSRLKCRVWIYGHKGRQVFLPSKVYIAALTSILVYRQEAPPYRCVRHPCETGADKRRGRSALTPIRNAKSAPSTSLFL